MNWYIFVTHKNTRVTRIEKLKAKPYKLEALQEVMQKYVNEDWSIDEIVLMATQEEIIIENLPEQLEHEIAFRKRMEHSRKESRRKMYKDLKKEFEKPNTKHRR